jgi:MoaA/NifB/PqqE/SkfB family radical SAM enzyme
MNKYLLGRGTEGASFFLKEVRARISLNTPFFIAQPRAVHIFFGNRCDGYCVFCGRGRNNKKLGIEESWKNLGEELKREDCLQIIEEAKELSGSGFYLVLTGGEPLHFEPIFEIMERASKSRIKFTFTTNGYNLRKTKAKNIAQNGIFNIGISLESIDPKINEELRPYPDGTRKTMATIENSLEARKDAQSNFSINIKSVVSEKNYRALPELIKYYCKIPGVFFSPQPYKGKITDKEWITDIESLKMIMKEMVELKKKGYLINADDTTLLAWGDYFNDAKKAFKSNKIEHQSNGFKCAIGTSHMFVGPDGNIKICPHMETVGNIKTESLSEIWHGDNANGRRKEILKCTQICHSSHTRSTSLRTKINVFLKSAPLYLPSGE